MIGKLKKDSRRVQYVLSDEKKTYKKKKSKHDPNNSGEKVILVNRIYKSLELIGIYENYKLTNNSNDDFTDYYEKHSAITRYWFRNRGIDTIYNLLKSEGVLDGLNYFFSKGSMKKTGIYICSRRVYEGTEVFVNRIIKYFRDNNFLWEFYINKIHTTQTKTYLDFQYDLITEQNKTRTDSQMNDFVKMLVKIGVIINV